MEYSKKFFKQKIRYKIDGSLKIKDRIYFDIIMFALSNTYCHY